MEASECPSDADLINCDTQEIACGELHRLVRVRRGAIALLVNRAFRLERRHAEHARADGDSSFVGASRVSQPSEKG